LITRSPGPYCRAVWRFQAIRVVVAAMGGLMLLGGLVALVLPLHGPPDDYGYVPDCGSAVRPIPPPGPAVAPINADECAQQQDDRRQLAIPFMITGVLLLTGLPSPALRPTESRSPTSWSEPHGSAVLVLTRSGTMCGWPLDGSSRDSWRWRMASVCGGDAREIRQPLLWWCFMAVLARVPQTGT
jgi:hypothetical protein